MILGYDLTLYYQIEFTNGQSLNKEYMMPAGSRVNLIMSTGIVAKDTVTKLKDNLNNALQLIDAGNIDQVSLKHLVGDTYHLASTAYTTSLTTLSKLLLRFDGSKIETPVTFGTIGQEVGVSYLFGLPINIGLGSISTNIYTTRQVGLENIGIENQKKINLVLGTFTSILESGISEKQFVKESEATQGIGAVSSIEVLNLAIQEGQKIYTINSSNFTSVESQLTHNQETMIEIQTAINAGFSIIIHSSEMVVSGWRGSGYVILDPNTNNGSYKITGGSNGGYLELSALPLVVVGGSLVDTLLVRFATVIFVLAYLDSILVLVVLAAIAVVVKEFILLIKDIINVLESCNGSINSVLILSMYTTIMMLIFYFIFIISIVAILGPVGMILLGVVIRSVMSKFLDMMIYDLC